MRLAVRASSIAPSPTVSLDAKTKQLLAEGIDVVSFAVGEPDQDTPEHIKRAGIWAIETGHTKYTPTPGTLQLRQAICRKLLKENGLEYSPEQIVVSNGGKQALYNALMVTVDPGEEVIIPAPYWVSYPEMVRLAGGVPVLVSTDESTGFKMTPAMLEAKMTPRSRVLILNSPSNPSGAVYTRAELEALAAVAVAHDLIILTDEIYEKLVYDGAIHYSIASIGPEVKRRTITVNGMSKAYAMTGWRIGYAASEPIYARAMSALQSQITSGPSAISQIASVQALDGQQEPIETMRQEFDRRRLRLVEGLRQIPGIEVGPAPQGAFYVFPRVTQVLGRRIRGRQIATSDDLANILLEEARVSLASGAAFGAPGYLRLSYATSMERIEEGLSRIAALLSEAE